MRVTGGITPRLNRAGCWEGLLHPDDAAVVERCWQQLQSGRSVTTEYRIITEHGQYRWLQDRARPLWNKAAKSATRILGAARDVTERKQAEEEARHHQDALPHVSRLSMLGEVTGQLAHEVNQPLCRVVGNAQTALRLLGSPTPDVAELRSALDDIVTAGTHVAEVSVDCVA
jgi:C4-dicarboxylate-specific signal transduction histidine kinase